MSSRFSVPRYSAKRPIPRRIDIIGDRDSGQNYIGMADSQLNILENQMSLGSQNIGSRTVKLDDGHIIECWKSLNLCGVKIYTPAGISEGEVAQKCFCACHVATGFIVLYSRHDCYDFVANPNITYDVEVCRLKSFYTLIQNAVPMGLTPFHNGQKVLVVFEPDPLLTAHYIPNINQGCDMIACRISNITEDHARYIDVPEEP